MSDAHDHPHGDQLEMGPAIEDQVPDSFRIQALERRVVALTNDKYALENQLTQAEARVLFQNSIIDALKSQIAVMSDSSVAAAATASNGHGHLDPDATIP